MLVLSVLHHPPTTLHHPVPVPVFFLSMCPLLLPLTHTQPSHTTTPHTHTRGGWCTLVPGVCVCAHGVGCGRAWLATHTSTHSLCPTPLLLLLLLVVVVDVVVAAWVLWRVWPLGPLTGCAGAVHSRITHTHGVMGTWWWWLCVVWLPPPLCAFPTNHHHCVRCPALSAV